MLNQNRPILYLPQTCDAAVVHVVDRLQQAGLQVIRTFDLHETRVRDAACACPHHGTENCDCQMVVLLLYGQGSQPASLVAHGHNGQTWFSLAEFLGETDTHFEAQIREIVSSADNDTLVEEVK